MSLKCFLKSSPVIALPNLIVTYNDQQLIAQTRYIDIVLGGHTHDYFEDLRYIKNLDDEETPCHQMGKHGRYVGCVEFTFTQNKRSK